MMHMSVFVIMVLLGITFYEQGFNYQSEELVSTEELALAVLPADVIEQGPNLGVAMSPDKIVEKGDKTKDVLALTKKQPVATQKDISPKRDPMPINSIVESLQEPEIAVLAEQKYISSADI
jgi:hypothetical protein